MTHPLVRTLLLRCPRAGPAWRQHLAAWSGEGERGVFNDLAVFAQHVVDSSASGDFASGEAVFAFIEQSLAAPSNEADFLIWGLLEDIVVMASHVPGLQPSFASRLGPRTMAAWQDIANAWTAKNTLSEVIRGEATDTGEDDGAA